MTTEPNTPLPGLPQPKPEEEAPRELTDLEVCTLNLQTAVVDLCASALREDMKVNPADVAGNIGTIVAKSMIGLMPPQAARLGILVAYEETHADPMTMFDIGRTKKALEKLADRRRRASKVTEGGIIIPGKD